jgi:hypothetical protein
MERIGPAQGQAPFGGRAVDREGEADSRQQAGEGD